MRVKELSICLEVEIRDYLQATGQDDAGKTNLKSKEALGLDSLCFADGEMEYSRSTKWSCDRAIRQGGMERNENEKRPFSGMELALRCMGLGCFKATSVTNT